ncbi:MAG: DMP19 family protein [Paludibacteraceae bacterium]|nr:DMP19 family protein [Paludibacteraceae bacterium]
MIQIPSSELQQALEKDNKEFLRTIANTFLTAIGGNLNTSNMQLLNGWQHVLLSWYFFSTEMDEGGFVQLIQNGYGGYIFDNPFAKALRLMGARELSKLIYRAKKIYDENKTTLERDTSEEEFNAMYVDFEQFDELEEEYFDMEEEQLEIISAYVKGHLSDFTEILANQVNF